MKQKTETKLRIEFNLDIENRPLKEDISKNSIGLSAFREQYKNALSAIDQYLAIARKDAHDRDLDSQNNIFLFVGDRGSGKTSCMLSIGELLLKEKSRREEFKDDYPDISNLDFYTIDLIDPSYFDSHHNIISLFLAKLYAKYKSKVNNDEKINENLKISFLNALTTAQNHAKMLLEESDSLDMNVIEQLENLSAAVDLKEDLKKLVDAYFECFGLKNSILLLRIDDIDLNAKEGNIMAEHIRKYFIQSNILVLMALKLDQLEIIKKNEYADLFKLHNDEELIGNMVERYLAKLFPQNQRIYMPDIDDILEKTLTIKTKNKTMECPSVRQMVPQLIFQKTRYLFYNSPSHVSFIVPRNLRDLRQLIKMLWNMPDYQEKIENNLVITKAGSYNQVVFKEYLKNTWIKNNLSLTDQKFAHHLLSVTENILLNDYIVKSLSGVIWPKEVAFDKELFKDILAEKNLTYNISTGDVLALISYLRQKNLDLEKQKLLFFITAVYSIRLYEAYNVVTEVLKLPSKQKDESEDGKDTDKEIFSVAQYQSLNDYEKYLLGYVFNVSINHFFSKPYLEHSNKIQGAKLQELMQGCLCNIEEAKTSNKLRLIEFFMLATSHAVALDNNFRSNTVMAFDAPIIIGKDNMLCYDLGAFFFNLTRIEKCYMRFKGLAKSGEKDIVDFILESDSGTLFSDFMNIAKRKQCSIPCPNPCNEQRDGEGCSHYDANWLSCCAFRNTEILLDFIESISQANLDYSNSDRLTLAAFFKKCSEYKIDTYGKETGSNGHHKISFVFLEKISELLKDNSIDSDFCAIFGRESTSSSDSAESSSLDTKHS